VAVVPGAGAGPGPGRPRDPFELRGPRGGPVDVLGGEVGLAGFEWAVPALVLTVPGILLILAIAAQAAAGVLWLPVIRRWLGGLGVRRRRHDAARMQP
jgi:hypothetical protein